ncbi:MAG: hypothetical protein K0R71_1791 [Bacillales bacterium]|jgi:hypothetical protein|nr:hypothetical protein [Bacillales bacterium]
MKDYKQQITDKVEFLKKCYIERDTQNIETLYNTLFGERSNPIIIGTSIDEWCFGESDVKQLFIDDWKYWGNVLIDPHSLVIGEKATYTWFYVNASVEFSFQDSEERYRRYFDSVKRIARSTKNNLAKAGDILWNLSTLLHSREVGERKYLWDITISGLVKNDENDTNIEVLQFSFPFTTSFPDVRTDSDVEMQQKLRSEHSKIRRYISNSSVQDQNKLKGKIVEFCNNNYQNMLILDEIKRYLGTCGKRMNGCDFDHYLKISGYKTILCLENLIVKKEYGCFIFCGSGEFTKDVSLDSEIENVLKGINKNEKSELTKETLFKIRRDLAYVIREASQSDKAIFPFRIMGLGEETKDGICLKFFQLSYPFYWFLEQKTDAEKQV